VALPGNTRPETTTATDLGAVPDGYAMPHLLLQLKRSPERQQALERTIEALHDPAPPLFHQWLDPADIGPLFGLSAADRQALASWLVGYGFSVNAVYDNGVLIDFSGGPGPCGLSYRDSCSECRRENPRRQHDRPHDPGCAGAGD
jgi:hypothetical protein